MSETRKILDKISSEDLKRINTYVDSIQHYLQNHNYDNMDEIIYLQRESIFHDVEMEVNLTGLPNIEKIINRNKQEFNQLIMNKEQEEPIFSINITPIVGFLKKISLKRSKPIQYFSDRKIGDYNDYNNVKRNNLKKIKLNKKETQNHISEKNTNFKQLETRTNETTIDNDINYEFIYIFFIFLSLAPRIFINLYNDTSGMYLTIIAAVLYFIFNLQNNGLNQKWFIYNVLIYTSLLFNYSPNESILAISAICYSIYFKLRMRNSIKPMVNYKIIQLFIDLILSSIFTLFFIGINFLSSEFGYSYFNYDLFSINSLSFIFMGLIIWFSSKFYNKVQKIINYSAEGISQNVFNSTSKENESTIDQNIEKNAENLNSDYFIEIGINMKKAKYYFNRYNVHKWRLRISFILVLIFSTLVISSLFYSNPGYIEITPSTLVYSFFVFIFLDLVSGIVFLLFWMNSDSIWNRRKDLELTFNYLVPLNGLTNRDRIYLDRPKSIELDQFQYNIGKLILEDLIIWKNDYRGELNGNK